MTDFGDKVRGLGVISRRTRPVVRDGRRPTNDPGVDAGQRCKATTDEAGTVIESSERQDVIVRPQTVRLEKT